MLTLDNLETLPGGLKLDYTLSHSTPGRDGTTLTSDLRLYVRPDKCWCEIKVTECEGSTPQESLDKMAAWLRRLADGIEQRKELLLPV